MPHDQDTVVSVICTVGEIETDQESIIRQDRVRCQAFSQLGGCDALGLNRIRTDRSFMISAFTLSHRHIPFRSGSKRYIGMLLHDISFFIKTLLFLESLADRKIDSAPAFQMVVIEIRERCVQPVDPSRSLDHHLIAIILGIKKNRICFDTIPSFRSSAVIHQIHPLFTFRDLLMLVAVPLSQHCPFRPVDPS